MYFDFSKLTTELFKKHNSKKSNNNNLQYYDRTTSMDDVSCKQGFP